MECWSVGKDVKRCITLPLQHSITPIPHHSITPSLRYSISHDPSEHPHL